MADRNRTPLVFGKCRSRRIDRWQFGRGPWDRGCQGGQLVCAGHQATPRRHDGETLSFVGWSMTLYSERRRCSRRSVVDLEGTKPSTAVRTSARRASYRRPGAADAGQAPPSHKQVSPGYAIHGKSRPDPNFRVNFAVFLPYAGNGFLGP
jgi:hypothetical protein